MSGSQKVQSAHLKRLAIVYLRQSSLRQVRENFRSTEREYGLAEKAAALGWEPARVLTVDADLGISGRGTHAREAYKELVGRVCLGEVGAIFGLEVARLARNNAELLRLLEFCTVTDTLVVDTDGIYDLKDFNDRTILGLKAQWSEAELHIMASRLQGAKRHAAELGELRLPLPIGYLYDDEGNVIVDPDEEVQAAVTDLFRAFAQTGSAYGVVGVFKDRRFPKRAHAAPWTGELRWERLRYSRVRQALTNPCYAGAYAFGRHRSRRAVTPEGTIVTKKTELPRAEWAVLIHDLRGAVLGQAVCEHRRHRPGLLVGVKLGADQIFGRPFDVLGLGAADLSADLRVAELAQGGVLVAGHKRYGAEVKSEFSARGAAPLRLARTDAPPTR